MAIGGLLLDAKIPPPKNYLLAYQIAMLFCRHRPTISFVKNESNVNFVGNFCQMETEQLIDSFKSKFATLAERYTALKAENARLAGENEELRQKLDEKEKEIAENKKEQNTQQLASTFLAASGNDPQEAKNKINKIVREIDNCIALLNR